MPISNDKYRTKITVRNDSVSIVGSTSATYSQTDDAIYVKKGDMSWDDFGFDNAPGGKDPDLMFVHERQHQINAHKGVGQADMSLTENYQRDVHNEITALIAEKLEIRRQYQNCKNDQERAAFFEKFAHDDSNMDYINAIKSGKVNPNSTSRADFLKEMAFIKDSSIQFRADPTDDAYKESWTKHAEIFLAQRGDRVSSNPEALKREVQSMYNIGGFDFNTVGRKDIYVIENQSISAADNFLRQGADPQKVVRFMQQEEGAFKLAESLDVSGLNKEQAEKVLQTAFVTQELSKDIAGNLALGEDPSFSYDYIARENREKLAIYLDMKSDIWEKNGTLSEQGDEAKFNELMKKAKEIELDPQGWYNETKGILIIAKDPSRADELAQLKQRIEQLQGKHVNFDDVITNPQEYKLPLDGTSKEEVLAEMARKEAENAKFWEEYYQEHPREQQRLSDPYEVEITDLTSNILGDELRQREENERIVEPLYPNKQSKVYTPIGDGQMIEVPAPKFNKAEIKTIVNEDDGTSTQVALIDGKKHGVELQYDKDGNILCDKDGNIDYKIYDHGKELDKSKHQVEFNIQTKDGLTYSGVKLDGADFGATIVTDENGKTKAAFYEQGGAEIRAAENAKIEKTTESVSSSREALKTQMQQDQQRQSVQMQNLDNLLYMQAFSATMPQHKEDNQPINTPLLQNQEQQSAYPNMQQRTPAAASMTPVWQRSQRGGR